MRTEGIKISPFDFLTIARLEINRMIGEHASATVAGYISDNDVEDYRWQLLQDTWVTISITDEWEENRILMTGVIAGFSMEKQAHDSMLTLEILSGTCLMDGSTHFRSFQNGGMTYEDVMRQINENYKQSGMIGKDCLNLTPCDFLLQYQETDWAFIKRIASYFRLVLTPSIVREGVLYHVGDAHYFRYELSPDTQYSVKKRLDQLAEQEVKSSLEYMVSVREVYELWDLLTFGRAGGYVYRIHSQYERGELIHTYYLCSLACMGTVRTFNERQAGCSFSATIKDVRQDMVQVTIDGDENSNQDTTRWFPYATGYSSPDGPAWYCMPEIGDQVRLQIPNRAEEDAYVISAVHMETGSARKNPEHKSFKTKYGKELLFTPGTIELTNNQGTSIKIIDGEGIQIVSDKDISITSGGNMTLSSESASLMIVGTESVDIRQGSAGLRLDDDVTFAGGKFRIQ